MSFADIFNAYSSKVSAEGRADAITSQPDIPGNVLYALSNALEENRPNVIASNNEADDIDVPEVESLEDNLGSDLSAEDQDKLMDSFSSLDDEPLVERPETLDDSEASLDVSSFDTLPEEFNIDESDQPAEEADLEQNTEADSSLDDDLGFDLLSEGDDAPTNADNDDWDMSFDLSSEVEAPEFSGSHDLSDLEIEAPEDLHKANEASSQEFEIPDFSDTNLETTAEDDAPLPQPVDIPNEAPAQNSSLSSPDFDLFSSGDSSVEEIDSTFNLSEEQVFLIREKINSIKNKRLRFELRNIMIDPKSYEGIYDSLLSLLLVDASEDKIEALITGFSQVSDSDVIMPSVLTKNARATFLADDVENYEHFKEDFRRVARRVTIAAIAIITLSVVLWSTVAQPLRIDNLYRRGLTAVRENRFTEGENLYTRAQQVAGRPSLKWTLEYGKVYETKSMVRLAEQKYRTALIIAPKDVPAAKQVAAFYTNLTPPNYNSALAIFSKLSSIYPKKFNVWDFYGSIYIGQAESLSNNIPDRNEAYFNAASVYRDFIIKNIHNPAPYYRLLEIYIQLDSAEKINQIYALIEQLDPKEYNIDILSRLAGYFIDRKELAEAERIFRRTIPYIDKNIGKLGDFRKRLDREFNIPATSISNVLGTAYYEFARYNMLSSDIPRAIRLLTNALIFAPSNANVHNLMGEAIMISPGGTDRIVEAKRNFDNAIKLDSNNYKPQVNLGHLYFYNERALTDIEDAYAKALYHYRLAVNLKPEKDKNFLLNYNLGWLEYRNANYPDALTLWSDIYKDEPSNPILSYALGSTFYQMNNPRLAQMEFQKSANSYNRIMDKIVEPQLNNPRHVELFSQTARVRNNLGVINANYAMANPGQRIRYEKDALLNFYAAKDAADRIRQIYNNAEYNILVVTHPNIAGRPAEFDNTVPKSTTINNKDLEFKRLVLEKI